MTLTFGWPPSALSPNSRKHWRERHRVAQAYRQDWFIRALEGGVRAQTWDRPRLHIEFVPPTRRRADLDNMLASIKHGIDGLALAMRCDDSRFRLAIERSEQIGGMVRVTITEAA